MPPTAPDAPGSTEALVSIVVPTYNRADRMFKTVESALAQTHRNLEVIVVDDASTDDTVSRAEALMAGDPRVRLVRQKTNQHANAARNAGVVASRGEFVNFMDSDDLLRPDKIARQLEALKAHPEADFCVCQIEMFREVPGDTGLAWNRLHPEHPRLRYAGNDVVWGTGAPLWRRAALDRVGPWDLDLKFHQDLDYHLRALCLGLRPVVIPDALEDYHDAAEGTITAATKRRKDDMAKLLGIYLRGEVLARENGLLDRELRARFAATYLWIAIVAAKTREKPVHWRAARAYRAADPAGLRRFAIGLLFPVMLPALSALGTGAKPLIDGLRFIGLPYHRWRNRYRIDQLPTETLIF